MQSCTSISTSTNLVQGKELSRNPVGFKESTENMQLQEINPYTVLLKKNVCKYELIAVEYQELVETQYAHNYYACHTEAYMTYLAHNITALGIPLLYDSVTGFDLFRERCLVTPKVFRISTAASNQIIKKEDYATKPVTCKDSPVADAVIKATIDDEVTEITTSAKGIASLPAKMVAVIKAAAATPAVTYQFESATLTTKFQKDNQ